MPFALRDYQQQAADDAIQFLTNAQPGDKRLYVSPCGTGKSVIEIAVQQALPDSVIITPRQEIIDGMIAKGGDPTYIFTPITLRNRLLEGKVPPPRWVVSDEAHHDTCDTADTIRLCVGDAPTVAFTATPWRGTPQGTQALRALYGEPHYVLTLAQAVERGLCELPLCTTHAVLDDDIVEITNGEFTVRKVEAKTPWRAAADLVHALWQTPRPTVVAMPSVQSCVLLGETLTSLGVRWNQVTGDTGAQQRSAAFAQCVNSFAVLLQVQVVSEGVDLPIRRLIDFAPTMSPVKWLQQLGRAMRPGGVSEYVCTNRNLLRHGYLLEGLLPSEAFAQAEAAFPAPSKRTAMRAFGLEGIGRLKPCRVPLANGTTAWAYYVTRTEKGHGAQQFVAIVLTNSPMPLWAKRENKYGQVYVDYGKWERCNPPVEFTGFASERPRPLSPKQAQWWRSAAARHGLDREAEVDAKTFCVLPVLSDLQLTIH